MPGGDINAIGGKGWHIARAAVHGDSALGLHPAVMLTAVGAILATLTTGIHLGGSSQGHAHPRQEEDCDENRTPFEPALTYIPYHNIIYKSKYAKVKHFI